MADYRRHEPASLTQRIASNYRRGMGEGRGGGAVARKYTNRRLSVTIVIVLAVASLLLTRLVYLQVFRASDLADVASSLRSQTINLEAKRGDIVDVHGNILATSVERYNVRANQVELESYREYDKNDKLIGTGAAAAAKSWHQCWVWMKLNLPGASLAGRKNINGN